MKSAVLKDDFRMILLQLTPALEDRAFYYI